jgi:hypothetical protein
MGTWSPDLRSRPGRFAHSKPFLFLWLGLAVSGAARAQAPQSPPANGTPQAAPLTAQQIAGELEQHNHERELALRKFQGRRTYHVEYHGFLGTRIADAVVDYSYSAPADKEFTIVSQSGSKILVEHVIKGLLSAEKESVNEDNKKRSALTEQNYEFALANAQAPQSDGDYVLSVTPKADNKFLYRGKIWVDPKDFAVTQIEAEPAKNPSFWLKKTEVKHRYEKVGDFWLPAENQSDSAIRLGGRAVLSIKYTDYKITEASPVGASAAAGGKALSAVATP